MSKPIVHIFLVVAALFLSPAAQAGLLKGRVTNTDGEAMPFTNVFVKGSTTGTASNEDGYYQLSLKPGNYVVVFQFVGYKAVELPIEMADAAQVRNVVLEPEAFNLNEVEVRATDEDPAYRIIREAIAKRKYHLNEVEALSCQVYVKGLQRLTEVPGKVLGFNVAGLEKGIVYLSESVSELYWEQPGKFRERMVSSKLSGKNRGFSFNKASDMDVNFYRNLIDAGGLHERGFVSPVAGNALMFYRYSLSGSSYQNDVLVHKIKVMPKRKNDPAFKGYIYITEGSWRIHSLDLSVYKHNGIEFVDSLSLSQVFAPTAAGPWVLRSQKFTFSFDAFGFTGNGYFLGVYSKYKVRSNYPAAAQKPAVAALPEETQQPEKPKKQATAAKPKPARKKAKSLEPNPADTTQVLPPARMKKNEIMLVEEESNTRDSAYWESIRPVPLTDEEVKDYIVKDSIAVYRESKVYKDSVDAIRNKISFMNVFVSGYTYSDTWREKYFRFDPIFRIWQYNTVEGIVANLGFGYTKRYEDRRRWQVTPTLRYGFGNELLSAKIAAEYTYKPVKFSTIAAEGGRFVQQFNENDPITPFINSVYTLFREHNYLKIYQKEYARVSWRSEIANGLQLNPYAEFAQRNQLYNTSLDKIEDFEKREFLPNTPHNLELTDTSFPQHQAFITGVSVRYRPGQEFMSRPDRKINLESKYPALTVHYRKGLPTLAGSDVDFDYLGFRIDDEIELGLLGTSEFQVTTGGFLRSREMYFMDYKHFSGNRTILAGNFTGFQLLDYYRYSTRKLFFEGHYTHFFNGFIFNKIPLFRKLRWQETATVNYLHTKEAGHYAEVGLGIEHIFKLFRADFFTGFHQGEKVRSGIRVGFGF